MSNIPALVITIVVAVLAIAAVIFAIKLFNSEGNSESAARPGQTSAAVDAPEIPQEMYVTARELIQNNHEILRLFYLNEYNFPDFGQNPVVWGDFEAETYENPSEDGFYTLLPGVINKGNVTYNSVGQIHELVDKTLSKESAERIKGLSIYKDKDGKIAVNQEYNPLTYDLMWEAFPPIKLFTTSSENEYVLEITLIKLEEGRDEFDTEITKQRSMTKDENGNWQLTDLIL
ncbi:MAG: hypothetical protein FWG83_05675 [Oscillospiraceae bacterium]|nr:hypothetical protein [Oscillospiraceae bacterium]